jgi:hypothetical protein
LAEAEVDAAHIGAEEVLQVEAVLRALTRVRDGQPRHARPAATTHRGAHGVLLADGLLQPELDRVKQLHPPVALVEGLAPARPVRVGVGVRVQVRVRVNGAASLLLV